MLRRFPTFQAATTCFSCSPPDLNLVLTDFMFCLHVKLPLPPGDNPIAVNKYIIKKLPALYGTQRFINVFTTAPFVPYPEPN